MTRLRALGVVGYLLAAVVFGQLLSNAALVPAGYASSPSEPAFPVPALTEPVGTLPAPKPIQPGPGVLLPALLSMTLGTQAVTPSGRVIKVPAGGNLQAALNGSSPGDVIELQAGAAFVGNFNLPNKPGAQWIVIRSSAHERLPAPGSRVLPEAADLMPKIVSPNKDPAISTAPRAHHYRLIGIEITAASSVNFNLVRLESPGQTSLDRVPTDIIFDRCYIHGAPTGSIRRGIALNGARLTVIDSYLSDFHERGADSQAIAGWNGPGPFKIVNNYLEAAGENVMFGGADPTIPNLVPSDIEIRRNHFFKPLPWKADEPDYAGIPWRVKNLFELKNARRVLVDGNVFEQNWVHAQNGFAILFTVRNQDGRGPWAVVEDVTFTNNVVRRSANGINVLGVDDIRPSEQTKRILIKNNLFEDVGAPRWGGGGRLFQLLNGTTQVVIEHNTAFQTGPIIMAEGAPHVGFIFRYNIAPHNAYGITGSRAGVGNPALERYFPGAIVTKNVIIGGDAIQYPPGNFFPASLDRVGFTAYPKGDYHLLGSSPYKRAAGGSDPGADLDAIRAAVGGLLRLPDSPTTR